MPKSIASQPTKSAVMTLQAAIFCRYLIKQPPSALTTELYISALHNTPDVMTQRDQALLAFITKHPWSIGSIDSYLALTRPDSEVRRRIFLTLAILETDPAYQNYFLPQEHSWLYSLTFIGIGLKAAGNFVTGVIITQLVRIQT